MIDQYSDIKTPCYVCDERLLQKNLDILSHVQQQSGAKILVALKGYAMWSTFEQIKKHLFGCTASGLYEARLASETFGKEVHTYSPAFNDDDIGEIARISDHLVFNSPGQFHRYFNLVREINPTIKLLLRVNPELSVSPVDLYNPCAANSRLGTTLNNFDDSLLADLDGLHFHALCGQNVDALEEVLAAFEDKFGQYFKLLKFINFGGGHHITRKDYDVERLIQVILNFKQRYPHISIYLEPGEAIGWEVGVLVTSVLDIIDNGMKIAILDCSAEAHMPDALAMPYRPDVTGAGEAGEKPYTYRFGGNTCLAGDIMGDYSFDKPLKIGDKICFEDQIHYTFVKSTTFNGIKLPSLATLTQQGQLKMIKQFTYEDYKSRLS